MAQLRAEIYLDYLDAMSEPLVRRLHAAGYLVDGSVADTEAQYEKALSLGVDMVESDDPISMRSIADRGRKTDS